MDSAFIQARIDATKDAIVAYENAQTALADGNVQHYLLDTGQTRQTVTRLDLADMQRMINSLYNRCATLEARLNGSGVSITRPAW